MSTYSPDLRITLITTGDQAGYWGTTTNTNLGTIIEDAISGYVSVSVTSANQAFTALDGVADEARNAMIQLTTTTTAAFSVYAPPVSKQYIIWNNSAYTATIYNWNSSVYPGTLSPAGTGVAIASGDRVTVFSDGTSFYAIKASNITGTLGIANGGTGQTTANAAFNALAPSQATANGKYLKSDGTNTSWDAIDISTSDVSGVLAVVNGGTGQSTYTNGQLLIGNTTGNTLNKATLTASTGISVTNGAGAITITNTAPDQTVSLTGAGATTISGTYPNFTISSVNTTYGTATTTVNGLIKLGSDTAQATAANAVTATASRTYALQLDATGNAVVNVPWTDTNSGGTVTSVAGTGTVSGLTLSGTVTTSGNITLGGSLSNIPNSALTNSSITINGSSVSLGGSITVSSSTATNISGGAANQIVAQSGASTTTFLTAPTVATTFLMWNGSAFTWSTVTPATGTVFASDISVNSLTVGRGNSGLITSTTVGYQASAAATASNVQQTAIGYRALATATTTAGVGFEYEGSTAIGYKALESSNPNILSSNTAVGAGALTALTTGGLNTAVGAGAGFSITTGNGATAIGTYAANLATNGSFVAVGYGTLRNALSRIAGSVAVGSEALLKATTYSGNSAIYNENNTAIGHNALYNLSAEDSTLAGSSNTALGRSAGSALVSGSNNMMLGSGAQGSTTSISNEITLGNSSITTLRCQVTSITSLSDQRDKYDIEDLPLGLSFVNALRPRRYKWDKRDWYVDEIQHEDGTVETVTVPKDGSRAQTDWNEGFVAQEAKAALQAAGADWFPLVYESNPEKLEMSSGKLIPVLVKAIQELTARLEALEAK